MGNLFNRDFLEFIDSLNTKGVKYILVGGYSVVIHGYPRTTGDLDIWVDCSRDNYQKIKLAFDSFRLPVFDMSLDNFLDTAKFDVFRFGRPPVAIDIITKLKGLSFDQAWTRVQSRSFEGVSINYIHFQDLLKAKKAAGRPKDINDLENLDKGNNDNPIT
jgi:hypothetical protein